MPGFVNKVFGEGSKMKVLITVGLYSMCALTLILSRQQITMFDTTRANPIVAGDDKQSLTIGLVTNGDNKNNVENSARTDGIDNTADGDKKLWSSSSSKQETMTSQTKKRRRRGVLTGSDMTNIVQWHNDYRRQVGASNMQMLTWNPTLAVLANNYSLICDFAHGQIQYDRNLVPSDWEVLGQNLAAVSNSTVNLQWVVDQWYNEVQFYNYNTLTCQTNKTCGHYTQLVWAETTDVGCALTFCPNLIRVGATNLTNANFIVCNYGNGGNIPGQKPFLQGSACTKCSEGVGWCNNGLCSPTCNQAGPNCECKAACNNCGTVNCTTCKCSCGVGFMGVDCTDTCRNINTTYCGANPGWPPALCTNATYGAAVAEQCPLMCGVCVAGNNTCTSSTPSTCPSPSTVMTTQQPPSTAPSTSVRLTSALLSTFQPSTASPSTARPSTALPSTARPSTALPSTARPSTALPSTVGPSTVSLSTARSNSNAVSSATMTMRASAATAMTITVTGPSLTSAGTASGISTARPASASSQAAQITGMTSSFASNQMTSQASATSKTASSNTMSSHLPVTTGSGGAGSATAMTTVLMTSSAGSSCAGRLCLHGGTAVILSDGTCYCWCPNNQYVGDLCQFSQQEANDGVILTITSPTNSSSATTNLWDGSAWPRLSPIIVVAVNDYCNSHLSQCCPNLAQSTTTGGRYVTFVDASSLHVGQGYPRETVSGSRLITQALVWATYTTDPQNGCNAVGKRRKRQSSTTGTAVSQSVLYNSLLSAQANLAQTLQSCCQSTVTLSLPPQYPVNSGFPLWAVAVIAVAAVIAVIVLVVCCLWCLRRQSTPGHRYFRYGNNPSELQMRRAPYDPDYHRGSGYYGYDRDRRDLVRQRISGLPDPEPERRMAPHMLMPVYVREPVVAMPKLNFARIPEDSTQLEYVSRQRRAIK